MVLLDDHRTSHFEVYRDIIKPNLELLDSYAYFNLSYCEDENGEKQNLLKINQAIAELKSSILQTSREKKFYRHSHREFEDNKDKNEPAMNFDKDCTAQKFCRILKSLDVGNRLVNTLNSLLNIPANYYHDYINTIEKCLDLLCVISKYDKVFQVNNVTIKK